MVKQTQTIRRQQPTKYLSVFDHFVALALKGLRNWAYSYTYVSPLYHSLSFFSTTQEGL